MKKMINQKTLKNDERAVSPVIAEILMVAIVVILAAVIAAFVFGVSQPAATTNPAYALYRIDSETVSITLHDFGGAMTIKALHNVTGDVESGATTVILGTENGDASVGATDDFGVNGSRAHVVVTANINGADKVVVDTTI